MKPFRVTIPLHVAKDIRRVPPELKRSIKSALRLLSADPQSGVPLVKELGGNWKYRVKRFRIVYSIDRRTIVVRVVAIGLRQGIYEEVAKLLQDE